MLAVAFGGGFKQRVDGEGLVVERQVPAVPLQVGKSPRPMKSAAFVNRLHGSRPVDHVPENGGGLFLFEHGAGAYVRHQAAAGIDDPLQPFGC